MKIFRKLSFCPFYMLFFLIIPVSNARSQQPVFNRVDTLRGSDHAGRNWWDVLYYALDIDLNLKTRKVKGSVKIKFLTKASGAEMMIDLQEPLVITGVSDYEGELKFKKEDGFWWISKSSGGKLNILDSITIEYEGVPKSAENPPWKGGVVWSKDEKGRPWIATACQGTGASSWWPCKDFQADEPDEGADISITLPDELTFVSNGRLLEKKKLTKSGTRWKWGVTNPINTYSVSINIGYYKQISAIHNGANGPLKVDFFVLDYNLKKGEKYMPQIKSMLECFEDKLGPYPFYSDGYKLVETPYLGMEHQSAIAYGNKFLRGYRGTDRSDTGIGLLWDFILIHESGHEWFGNSITASDVNDNWIHEGFTTYTETIYTECLAGKEAAYKYLVGQRKNIKNDRPLIGSYHVRNAVTSDIYDKGASLVHMIRVIMDDDERFYGMLREMNKKFYHKTVSSSEVENFISDFSGYDFSKLFDQYLRTTRIPKLEYKIKKKCIRARWINVVKNFEMPVYAFTSEETFKKLKVSNKWKKFRLPGQFVRWGGFMYFFPDHQEMN